MSVALPQYPLLAQSGHLFLHCECLLSGVKRTSRFECARPAFEGKNLVKGETLEAIVGLVLKSSGTNGSCRDYVISLATKLKELGIVAGGHGASPRSRVCISRHS
jgi:hypothetical protein